MIGVQDADSCGRSETGETPQERIATRRLTGRPRKAKSCTEINSVIELADFMLKIIWLAAEVQLSFIEFMSLLN
ncbi:hypothetical protein [Bacillus sp. Marseille-Q1617]|uniref:hypothetical protein n=1 Tax=Bacillus sp. Marseille-Q1617 TaxID=2736887 RepID=UPI00158E9D77|nr:hypothetical protein [Bacillus sp. Marseille-Q1617]